MKIETKCNCPMCTGTEMKQNEVYKCVKGGIMGICEDNSNNIPITSLKKVFINYYDNIKNN